MSKGPVGFGEGELCPVCPGPCGTAAMADGRVFVWCRDREVCVISPSKGCEALRELVRLNESLIIKGEGDG